MSHAKQIKNHTKCVPSDALTTYKLYEVLLAHLSHQGDWPAESKEEIILGAILVQNTRWENAQLSIQQLRKALADDWRSVHLQSLESIQSWIRPSGFHTNKSRAIVAVFSWLASYQFDYAQIARLYGDQLRQQLLSLRGVGEETADVLLLYVFDQITFVADKYARTLFAELWAQPFPTYASLYRQVNLHNFTLAEAQQFHILIDEFGKTRQSIARVLEREV